MVPLLQQGMLGPCKCRVLLPCTVCWHVAIDLCTLGAPSLAMRLSRHWSLPFMQASAALPMSPHGAVDSHLVWSQWMILRGISKQRNFRCLFGKRAMLTNCIA